MANDAALGFALGTAAGLAALETDAILRRAADSQSVRKLIETPDDIWETE